ncbi:MAG: hypothetical protein SO007_01145 [Candidatus Enteromonas sp.]|nr:hypothetical protein [Candidatus Enteromonas sp.]
MKRKVLCLILGSICLSGLASCQEKETVYTVEKRDFYYSIDNGATYGNERFELEVGQTVLMKVLVTVTTNKNEKEMINGSLTIPNINAIDAYYIRGKKITPTTDAINNITTYPFTISTNEDWTFIFEFQPASEARVQMLLDFEEPIPEIYDGIYTIKFVNPVQSDSKGSSEQEASSND